MVKMTSAPASYGKTADFESANRGSSPRGVTITASFEEAIANLKCDLEAQSWNVTEPMMAVRKADICRILAAQGIEAGTATTEGRGPKDESLCRPVAKEEG